MADKEQDTASYNCTRTMLNLLNSANADDDTYKTQVLIIECVIGAVVLALIGCVIYLFYWVRKLQSLVNALDPMSKYKKVGPSLYMKRPQRDTSSISSSFKHFDASAAHKAIPDDHNDDTASTRDKAFRKNDVGTLDRNFFTRNEFSFDNSLNSSRKGNASLQKKNSDLEAMDAITALDKVLY